ncbi:MAG: inorganic diphosphatase [Acidobacteriaceae bacterium]|nr:inorganic diphosphatase [Acidobacteriaceae bacterium]
MQNIERIPHQLDKAKRECKAIIETPKGRRNKFKFEPEFGLFTLSRVLPEGFTFPFDFGFIPSTKAEDGDPMDVIVLMDEPAHVGCILPVRIIGVIKVQQTEDGKTSRNDRLVGVALQSFAYKDVSELAELRNSLVDQLAEFLALYNKNSGKRSEIEGVDGPDDAIALLEKASKRFKGHAAEAKA